LWISETDCPRQSHDANIYGSAARLRVTSFTNHLRHNTPGYVRRLVYAHAELWGGRGELQGKGKRRRRVAGAGTAVCKWVVSRILGTAPPPRVTPPADGTDVRTAADILIEEVRQKILRLPAAPNGEAAPPSEQLTGAWVEGGGEERLWSLLQLFMYIARKLKELGARQICVLPMGDVARTRFITLDTRAMYGVLSDAKARR
jgi:hypothetical protein